METRIVKNVRKIKATDNFVYNLNVKNNHNYFVNDILVHNCDEAGLISDQEESLIFRMLGDQPENYYFKVGNPWGDYRHFFQSFKDEKYFKKVIDCYQGLKEGRITQNLIDEARGKHNFGVLYECKFPDEGASDEQNYAPLITPSDYEKCLIDNFLHLGEKYLGIDVAGGGKNFSVVVLRSDWFAEIIYKKNEADTMKFAGDIIEIIKRYEIKPENVFIDKIGVGKGCYDNINSQGYYINGVAVGMQANNQEEYSNIKAENAWKTRIWLLGGGKLKGDFSDILNIKFKHHNEKTIKIKSKEEMAKDRVESPDVFDALSLSFTNVDTPQQSPLKPNTRLINWQRRQQRDDEGLYAGV